MAARNDTMAQMTDLLGPPGLSLHEPKFVALMFLLGLGDPVEFRRGLEQLVTPESLARWGDFSEASDLLATVAPWKVRGFAARDMLEPDIAYVRVRADRRFEPGDVEPAGDASKIVTLVRPPGHGERWSVHDFGRPNRLGSVGVSAVLARRA